MRAESGFKVIDGRHFAVVFRFEQIRHRRKFLRLRLNAILHRKKLHRLLHLLVHHRLHISHIRAASAAERAADDTA